MRGPKRSLRFCRRVSGFTKERRLGVGGVGLLARGGEGEGVHPVGDVPRGGVLPVGDLPGREDGNLQPVGDRRIRRYE